MNALLRLCRSLQEYLYPYVSALLDALSPVLRDQCPMARADRLLVFEAVGVLVRAASVAAARYAAAAADEPATSVARTAEASRRADADAEAVIEPLLDSLQVRKKKIK